MKRSKTMAVALTAGGYEEWIRSIKERIQRARVKASMLVNSEQTLLYWDIGHEILEKQENEGWGSKVIERMSADLKARMRPLRHPARLPRHDNRNPPRTENRVVECSEYSEFKV